MQDPPVPDQTRPAGVSATAGTYPPDDPEGRLLAAWVAGDPVASRQLVAALAPRAHGQAMRMLANRAEAEEVVQDALLRLWRLAPEWQAGRARVSTWLYRVVANLATDRLRQRRHLPPAPVAGLGPAMADPAADQPDPAPPVEQAMVAAERARALSQAMAGLPERQAQAVALRHLEELPLAEIGRIMELSEHAVESLIARGKRALTQALSGRRADLGFGDD